MSGSAEEDRGESFVAHLVELRGRLLRAVVTVMLVFAALMPFAQQLYTQFAQPLLNVLPAGGEIIAIDPASPFFAPLKLAFVTALVISMPMVIYQLWAFVAPGLYRHEQRLARPLLVSASLLFYLGCAFAWFFVLPTVFGFLTAMTPDGVAMKTDIAKYLDFVLVIFIAFGFCFEVPVAVVIVRTLGWLSDEQLREARPYVIVGAFVIAAILTPPDVVSQLMLAIPMCLLYEVGLIAARSLPHSKTDAEDASND
ncbi:twin-arginine translocase subunit TatC [Pseudomarimonas arenosa]|uniref:Sec-independent protein translocase protein TatC n=1 Tax=Pseudomarimonas arenosa TaxID=2774145 RepID=A0AAW3ZQS4_9GAMM|nr:twin-arginine translocase subunit TatC [Pseudomarimonas arenosa]MBD8526626.1 twin-arginine translocase subunit TatC [Pseudomarimonas arenosa]